MFDTPMIVLCGLCVVFSIMWWGSLSEDISVGVLAGLIWIVFAFYWLIYGTVFPMVALAFGFIGIYIWLQVFAESLELFG